MATIRNIFSNKNAAAWALLMTALALHVVDETATDFLPFYNHVVHVLRDRLGFFPMPTFTFSIWLGGLIFWVLLGFAVIPVVQGGGKTIRILTLTVGILMVLNALGHITGSIYLGRLLPGFWSAPLLLVTSGWVVSRGLRGEAWKRTLSSVSSAKA